MSPLDDDELFCPKCRAVTKLGEGGIDALPVNFDLKVSTFVVACM